MSTKWEWVHLEGDVAGDEVIRFNCNGGAQVSTESCTVLSDSGSSVTPL
jgi:hypothetical protein